MGQKEDQSDWNSVNKGKSGGRWEQDLEGLADPDEKFVGFLIAVGSL